jgi:2-hydroxychromene-2-carboxylate isomerase
MNDRIDYYFTPVSPFAYLGHARLAAIARDAGVAVDVKPVDIGRVFASSGGLPLAKRAPQRQAYRLVELQRWRDFLGIALNVQPRHFPCPGDAAAKWILAAAAVDARQALQLAGAFGRALWAEERDIADARTLADIVVDNGLDAPALALAADSEGIAARYEALTAEAMDRGVFGAPTYIYRGEMFWGQDRLDFLARKLAK